LNGDLTLRLSELKSGEEGVVIKIDEIGSVRRRIMDMGIVRGSKVKVLCRAPLGDPMELEIRDYKLTLRRREAENIFVDTNGGQ
jgi:ferrous iron transport protein A